MRGPGEVWTVCMFIKHQRTFPDRDSVKHVFRNTAGISRREDAQLSTCSTASHCSPAVGQAPGQGLWPQTWEHTKPQLFIKVESANCSCFPLGEFKSVMVDRAVAAGRSHLPIFPFFLVISQAWARQPSCRKKMRVVCHFITFLCGPRKRGTLLNCDSQPRWKFYTPFSYIANTIYLLIIFIAVPECYSESFQKSSLLPCSLVYTALSVWHAHSSI